MKAIIIFFLLYLNHIYSQNKIFYIKTEEGEPIPYVNIGIQGTQKGLVSNKDGSFSSDKLRGNPSDSLYFSHLSYKRKIVALKDLKNDIILQRSEINLPSFTFSAKRTKIYTLKHKGLPTLITMKILGKDIKGDNTKTEDTVSMELGDFITLTKNTILTHFEFNILKNTFDTCTLSIVFYKSNEAHNLFTPIVEKPIYIEVPYSRKKRIIAKEISVLAPKGIIWVGIQIVDIKGNKDAIFSIRTKATGGYIRSSDENIADKVPLGLGFPFSLKGYEYDNE